jgi:hypothetical protein
LALHTNVKFGLLTGCSLQIKEVKQAQPIAFISYQSHGIIILVPKFVSANDPTRFTKKYSNPDQKHVRARGNLYFKSKESS